MGVADVGSSEPGVVEEAVVVDNDGYSYVSLYGWDDSSGDVVDYTGADVDSVVIECSIG